MREANRAFLSSGTLNLVKLACGYARVKFVALTFGAAGVGLLAQANQLQMFGITLGTLALGSGMIQRMLKARSQGDKEAEASILGTVLRMQLLILCLIFFVVLLFQGWILDHIFDNKIEPSVMWLVVVSVPMAVLANEYLGSSLYGRDRYDLNVRANIQSTILGLFIFVGGAYWKGIPGAIGALSIMALAQLASFLREASRIFTWRELFLSPFCWYESKAQLRFGAIVLLTGIGSQGLFLLLRSEVVQRFGFETNGWVHVPFAISAYYLPFFTGAIWGRLFLIASDPGLSKEPKKELGYFFKICVLGIGSIILSILVLPKLVLSVLYSKDFLPAIPLLEIHFIGDLFYIVGLLTTTFLLGQGRLRTYSLVWFVYFLIYFTSGLIALRGGHVYGVSLAHCSAALFMAVAGMITLRFSWRYFALLAIVAACISLQDLFIETNVSFFVRLAFASLFLAVALHVTGGVTWLKIKYQEIRIRKHGRI